MSPISEPPADEPLEERDSTLQLAKSFVHFKTIFEARQRHRSNYYGHETAIFADYGVSDANRGLAEEERKLEELKPQLVDSMLLVVQWAAKVANGTFLPQSPR